MITSEKADLTVSFCHIEKFPKSGIRISNSELPDASGRKTRRRRTQVKHYAFHANAISHIKILKNWIWNDIYNVIFSDLFTTCTLITLILQINYYEKFMAYF